MDIFIEKTCITKQVQLTTSTRITIIDKLP